ncbi:MAG: RNA polymerase-binding transcription factor DksA [Saprospiraceae bacterium]|jgi:RNA polymerase-binding transcription factor DksA|tara:strand:+ start:300 stop:671 length:372 start_codon:yes stop_codon:yes gene_type:complete
MNSQNVTHRYSDKELEGFKLVIEMKLSKARKELKTQQLELLEIEENGGNRFNNINESSLSYEREHLSKMLERQQRFVRDLENALLRTKNKTYGVCIVTGELIDKRRLKAVPHTTKSIQAKMKR